MNQLAARAREFDSLFSALDRSMVGGNRFRTLLDQVFPDEGFVRGNEGYPKYNVVLEDENKFTVELALAGWSRDELSIDVEPNSLTITGKKVVSDEDDKESKRKYLHRGIASREFSQRFVLDDFVEVSGAEMVNGILKISLQRIVPEELKPRKIKIE